MRFEREQASMPEENLLTFELTRDGEELAQVANGGPRDKDTSSPQDQQKHWNIWRKENLFRMT